MEGKWSGFAKELANLIFFWIFGILFFTLFKFIFLILFADQIGDGVTLLDYLLVLFTGFLFDGTVVCYFVLPPLASLLVLVFFSKFELVAKIRRVFQGLFVILSAVNCLVTLNYFGEYNSQYNNFLFMGLLHDDKVAIAKTVVEAYHPILNSLILLLVIVSCLVILRLFEKREAIYRVLIKIKLTYGKSLLVLVTLFLFVSSIRGSFYGRPISRGWACVTSDSFLNKTVINPFRMIKYAYEDYTEFNNLGNKNPYGDCPLSRDEIQQQLEKVAKGRTFINEQHKQIFLVIMESYDSWSLMEEYRPLKLSTNLSRLADEGTHFKNFLPAYDATFYAYGSLVTGIPCCGINICKVAEMSDPYITSIFAQFKKLGYQTNFYYGGFPLWQNIGDFSKYLQCDNVYFGVDMADVMEAGAWGIADEKVFDFALKNTNPEEYTFNVILTLSHHSPYEVDVKAKGFPYETVEDLPKEMQHLYKGGISFLQMGHLWYGDWAIGEFMKGAEAKFNNALYAFTGDHFGRYFLSHTPNLEVSSTVPFVLYGRGVPNSEPNTPGGHADILPTLIEMEAPKGFKYYAFGSSMFDSSKSVGFGFEKIITKDRLYYFPKSEKEVCFDLVKKKECGVNKSAAFTAYKECMKRAWSFTMDKMR